MGTVMGMAMAMEMEMEIEIEMEMEMVVTIRLTGITVAGDFWDKPGVFTTGR